jgi:hypothetical protein
MVSEQTRKEKVMQDATFDLCEMFEANGDLNDVLTN